MYSFTQEGNGETRNSGKKAAVHVARLVNNPKEFAILAKRSLTDKQVETFLEIIERENSNISVGKKHLTTNRSKLSPILSRKPKT